MDVFEYLPQLIVAYDGNDEFANLIHVKKADKDKDYFCPCCGGIVKPRALDSNKEQSHYYHKTGKCTKESQLHFFCKNWLFEEGSKFYINDELFEVKSIEIEKVHNTIFGDYKPDITVYTTCGKTIYFEMFFSNRKTGDDYFCKWNNLGNDVVEIDIKEYMYKTDTSVIPVFTYLYHDGVCYSKPYVKKDLYANTIAKIKNELTRQKVLNYKARIEQLDWFWQAIRDDTKEDILDIVSNMEYEDMVSCYEIIKRKHCVSYLKNEILEIINQKVIDAVRKEIGLPYDENVYFDLNREKGRTYYPGIRLNIKTDHIAYDDFISIFYGDKIVFSKNIFNKNEIKIPDEHILQNVYRETLDKKSEILKFEKEISDFEKENEYKIKINCNYCTVLSKIHGENFEPVLKKYYMGKFNILELSDAIKDGLYKIKCEDFIHNQNTVENIKNAVNLVQKNNSVKCVIDIRCCKSFKGFHGIYFLGYVNEKCIYNKKMEPNDTDLNVKINECIKYAYSYCEKYNIIYDFADKINNCKNKFWKASVVLSNQNILTMVIDQNIFTIKKNHLSTYENVYFNDIDTINEDEILERIEYVMHRVLKNMERCGYRVMD